MSESSFYQKRSEIVARIRKKVQSGSKLRVCFSVIYDSIFSAENVLKKMLNESVFEPCILVIPDTSRGEGNMFYQMDKTYKTLCAKYKNIYHLYDFQKKEFIDWSDKMDVCFFANPYDSMTHEFYTVKYLSDKCFCVHVPYGYTGLTKYSLDTIYRTEEYSTFSKIFAENRNVYKLIKEHQKYSVDNLEVVGYPKMDSVAYLKVEIPDRPLIVLAPHHTVRKIPGFINISNFLRLSEFYLELPKKYPQIDFIFRPHPLLFITLSTPDLWGKEKVDEYIAKVRDIPNMQYQEGEDYFETFAKSSALIHDCGSFFAEYFYFDKPQCYILENDEKIQIEFSDFGRLTMENVYRAYTEKDIENFINDVVINKNDFMRKQRQNFAKGNIITNHPNVSKLIVKSLKKEFGCENMFCWYVKKLFRRCRLG